MTFWHNHNNHAFPADKMLPRHMYVRWFPRGYEYLRVLSRTINPTVKHLHTRKSRQYTKAQIEYQLQEIGND